MQLKSKLNSRNDDCDSVEWMFKMNTPMSALYNCLIGHNVSRFKHFAIIIMSPTKGEGDILVSDSIPGVGVGVGVTV